MGDEYLAQLGFDTSDLDKAVDQTITLLGHLGAAFPEVAGKAEAAERALGGAARASREQAKAIKEETSAIKGWTSPMSQRQRLIEEAEKNNLKYGASTLQMTKQEREFQSYLAQGASNDAAYSSSQARAKALADETDVTRRAAQARQGLVAEFRGEETARKAELAGLRSAIQGRYADAAAIDAQTGNLSRLRYAVFDVSNALGVGGLAAAAFVAGIIGANVAFERSFADVRRTVGVTGDDADRLYNRFLRISTEIPVAFSSLAEIGTAAGQLGIAESRVASFTETVAKFSATTDVSVDASATAFGRLDQLLDDVNGRYQNLASSILNVGINSVATESQIISIASQIAATASQAGLAADEVVGLSGSLASLGIAPEAARGTILRVFGQINNAISTGGERLNDFAAISRMTAADFKSGWSDDFTGTFLSFLQGIQANGGDAEQAIRALGITAARDVNTLLKLAQNAELVSDNFALAATGMESAAVLTDSFGIIADTNASRLQVLTQTAMAFFATLGEGTSGPLAHFLELATNMLRIFTDLAASPVGQTIATFGTIVTGTIAVMLLLGAVTGRAAGTFLALKTAMGETYIQTMLAKGGLQQYTATLLGAAGAQKAFNAALSGTLVGLAITTAIWALTEGISAISKEFRSGEQVATDYFGNLDGLADAIKADNVAIFAANAEKAKNALADAAGEGGTWIEVLESAAKAQADLAANTDEGSDGIDQQTLAIGKNTDEWLRNALASNENFRAIFADMKALKELTSETITIDGVGVSGFEAFDMAAFGEALAKGGVGAGEDYIYNFQVGVAEAAAKEGITILPEDVLFGNEALTRAQEAGAATSAAFQQGLDDATQGEAVNSVLNSIFGETEASAEATAAAFRSTMDDVYGLINAEMQLSENTQKLGADFATNGAQVASSGAAMQAVIQSIYASSSGAPEAANRLQGLFDALVRGGYASAAQLAPLQTIIASLAGGGEVKAVAFDMSSFATGITKVGKAAGGSGGGAAKAVRTLVDYANDLRTVLSRSFDLRFGKQAALDEVRNGWQKIKDEIAATNEEIAEYEQKMLELNADKAIREYWLTVANAYGDTLRAGVLRAEIADIDNELAKTSAELTKAQQKNSKITKGNSQAARDNRAEISGMVGDYQDYITTLAASGLSQAELQKKVAQAKAEFIAQAVALGYSKEEAKKYARAFDDMAVAIAKVPRNITVKANTNPALQAINELQARLTKVGNSTYTPTIKTKADNGQLDEQIKKYRKLLSLQFYTQNGGDLRSASGVADLRKTFQTLFGFAPGFRDGGWTGGGSSSDVAGFVHKREFVLNETGAQMFPRQMLNAANQGRAPYIPSSGGGASGVLDQISARQLSTLQNILAAIIAGQAIYIGDEVIGRAADRYHEGVSSRGGR